VAAEQNQVIVVLVDAAHQCLGEVGVEPGAVRLEPDRFGSTDADLTGYPMRTRATQDTPADQIDIHVDDLMYQRYRPQWPPPMYGDRTLSDRCSACRQPSSPEPEVWTARRGRASVLAFRGDHVG